jgi:outer membrane protein
MKRVITLAVFAFMALSMGAQPASGNFFVGGILDFSAGANKSKSGGTTNVDSKTTGVTILPLAGYFLSDKLAVGAGLGFNGTMTKYPGANLEKTTSSMLIIEPFARYYLLSGTGGIFAEAEALIGFGKNKTFYTDVTNEANVMSLSIGITPGVYYYITPKLALEGKFGWIGFTSSSTKAGDNKSINNNFELDVAPSYLSFGFTYVL